MLEKVAQFHFLKRQIRFLSRYKIAILTSSKLVIGLSFFFREGWVYQREIFFDINLAPSTAFAHHARHRKEKIILSGDFYIGCNNDKK